MKLNFLETHDRLEHLKKQNFNISDCCQNLIEQRPFGEHSFYIFAHARTDDDGVTKRLIWQPRLTKPKAQTNSMLFKAYPGSDVIKVMWIIPPREMWDQYKKDKMTENKTVLESIEYFENNRQFLEKKEDDDLSDEAIDAIYTSIRNGARYQKAMETLYLPKPGI